MNAIEKLATVAGFAVVSLLAAACGQDARAVVSSGEISARQASVSLVDRAAVPYENEHLPEVTEVIEIRLVMQEFGYGAQDIEVPVGATVRFVFENSGFIEHEAVVGDMDVQMAQAAAMAQAAEMAEMAEHEDEAAGHDDGDAAEHDDDEMAEHDEDAADHEVDEMADMRADDGHGDHGDAPVLILAPGASGELVLTFDEVGEFLIGCHVAGHWESGMQTVITVV